MSTCNHGRKPGTCGACGEAFMRETERTYGGGDVRDDLLAAVEKWKGEAAALRAQLADREREVERLSKYEPRLMGIHPDGKGVEVAVKAPEMVEIFATVWADWFKETGAENYVECRVHHRDGREFVFTLRLADKKTPHDLRREAERERDEARAEVAALRRLVAHLDVCRPCAEDAEPCEAGAELRRTAAQAGEG